MKIIEIVNKLESWYPEKLADESDFGKLGLQIGDPKIDVTGILFTLDLTLEVVEEAIQKNANLIVSHHPFIYNPIQKVEFDSMTGMILQKMFSNRISLYAMHTNLDVGYDGVNDSLAKLLDFKEYQIPKEKIVANQFLRYGKIKKQTLKKFAEFVKETFDLKGIRVAGDLDQEIETAGIIGGSGASYELIDQALDAHCDVYITGEVSLHTAQYAISKNLAMIEVNHGVEKFVFPTLLANLKKEFPSVQMYITVVNTDPLVFIG